LRIELGARLRRHRHSRVRTRKDPIREYEQAHEDSRRLARDVKGRFFSVMADTWSA